MNRLILISPDRAGFKPDGSISFVQKTVLFTVRASPLAWFYKQAGTLALLKAKLRCTQPETIFLW
jgi:hypothetical protein